MEHQRNVAAAVVSTAEGASQVRERASSQLKQKAIHAVILSEAKNPAISSAEPV
jgi:hypothetical protein